MNPVPPRDPLRRSLFAAAIASSCVLGAGACYLGDTGLPPFLDQIYYPTGLVVSPAHKALYIVNSDFDLQYNGGTVQAIDLATLRNDKVLKLLGALRGAVTSPSGDLTAVCRGVSLERNDSSSLAPGPCTSFPLRDKFEVKASVEIGAFGSGAVLVHNQDPSSSGARLFVAVRGDPSITWFNVADDRPGKSSKPCGSDFCLECGAVDKRCSDDYRLGKDPFDNPRNLTLPVEPVGQAVSDDGSILFVTHQTEKTVSASLTGFPGGARPQLQFTLANTADGPTEVAAVPMPALLSVSDPPAYQPGFMVTYRNAAELDLFRFNDDSTSAQPRPFITLAYALPIAVNADGKDSRGVAIDPHERKECEATCAAEDAACLRECVAIPIPFYIANRTPPSLLVGRVVTEVVDSDQSGPGGSGVFDRIELLDTISLAVGASKVGMGQVITPEGNFSWRAFAVAFDSLRVFSYDPEAHRVDAVITTGRGPHAIAFDADLAADPPYALLYVGHFTDSYLGVVDLDMRHPETFGTMFASIGTPTPPRESK